MLRRLCANLRKVYETLSNRRIGDRNSNIYLNLKETVSKKIFALRMGVDRACSYRESNISLLRNDIINAPKHIFEDHSKCAGYFCEDTLKENEVNLVPTLSSLNILQKVGDLIIKVAQKSDSLI